MKMSDKPHCLLTEDLKNMQTHLLAIISRHTYRIDALNEKAVRETILYINAGIQ